MHRPRLQEGRRPLEHSPLEPHRQKVNQGQASVPERASCRERGLPWGQALSALANRQMENQQRREVSSDLQRADSSSVGRRLLVLGLERHPQMDWPPLVSAWLAAVKFVRAASASFLF